jgi:hypothetical protein
MAGLRQKTKVVQCNSKEITNKRWGVTNGRIEYKPEDTPEASRTKRIKAEREIQINSPRQSLDTHTAHRAALEGSIFD